MLPFAVSLLPEYAGVEQASGRQRRLSSRRVFQRALQRHARLKAGMAAWKAMGLESQLQRKLDYPRRFACVHDALRARRSYRRAAGLAE
jgi:hypothetical protein